ncbi:MAG: molybdopterin cofactor-binding domain-containing protein [Acidobacteriota bacterium]
MKKIQLKVNGRAKQLVVDEDLKLLDYLREHLGLTGAKQSCDRKGQCGACTVVVNGKATRSCLAKVARLDGADVITVEGLGTPENPHLIQEAFVLAGAIQCGFCTPGMIMMAKAFLDTNPNPGRDEIKKAFRGNLCRCTGYQRIIEAVELAARFLRGETTPAQVRPSPAQGHIGVSHPRPSSLMKACGVAQFTADIPLPNALELAVVRSPHHNARLKRIDSAKAEKMPGVAGVMTAKDIKGSNSVGMLMPDEPILCADRLPLLGAPIAIVAAETRAQALAAAEAVHVEYEVLPRISTPEEAMAENAPTVHDGLPNIILTKKQIKGDAQKALSESAVAIEGDFETQIVHQAALEPEVAAAYLEGEGEDAQLVIFGRSIAIHLHALILQGGLGWGNIRYEEPFVGGQFGIKSDITSEGIVGAAALHFRRPVRYIPSLTESFWMTTKRHPYQMKVRLGADAKGKLTGYEMNFVVENGAHTSTGPIIVGRSIEMLSGSYQIPNVFAEGRLVYTNNIWGGSARGAGPPQVNYAFEVAMDLLAHRMKIDPYEFRRMNALQVGESMSTGHVVDQWAFNECIAKLKPDYERAKKEAKAKQNGHIRRGVGIAGASFGVGGAGDISNVAVELDPDGGLTVYGSVADPGEGNDAMLSQIAAHLMSLPQEKIRLVTRDSTKTPDSGVSAGSRQTYLSGHALVKAIEALKSAMKETGAKTHQDLLNAGKPTRYLATHTMPHTGLDPEAGQGIAWESQIHGIQMAEVEVDTKTGEVRILKMTAVVDPGTIINPLAVIGQLEGGMDMGAGMALREEYVHGESVDWITYKFPTMRTTFDMKVLLSESPRKGGPLGCTGVGEFTLVPTHPAIANAVYDAIGVPMYRIPITPERLLAAMGKK